MASGRRFPFTLPVLTGRPWPDVAHQLQDFLRRLYDSEADGIPPGFNERMPTTVEAGVGTGLGDPGTEGSGWAAADHDHVAATGLPVSVGVELESQEGVATTLVRSDHRHEVVSWKRVGLTIDGGLNVITTGVKGFIAVPFRGTIDSWEVESDVVGSCVIDVWKARRKPVASDSICGVYKPTLTGDTVATGVVTDWSTTVVEVGDVFAFNVESISGSTVLTLKLKVRES